MAYNISVKFKDRFIRPLALGRARHRAAARPRAALQPGRPLLYPELAWIFQHKMGAKPRRREHLLQTGEWAREMTPFFGPGGTNFTALIHPQTPGKKPTPSSSANNITLTPCSGKNVDDAIRPARLAAARGARDLLGRPAAWKGKGSSRQSQTDDLITLRRGIYQSILQAFKHGRMITDPFSKTYSLVPNLDLVTRANDIYLQNVCRRNQSQTRRTAF